MRAAFHASESRRRRRRFAEDVPASVPSHAGKTFSMGRMSADSGAGSMEDCQGRECPTPVAEWEGIRRHTAPLRKPVFVPAPSSTLRPNTVHAWDRTSSCRSALSRYKPLPSIGGLKRHSYDNCNDSNMELSASLLKLRLGSNDFSESDSDFDESSELGVYPSEDDDEPRQRRPILRSATFTIDKRNDTRWSMLLAIRLPNGSRISGNFSLRDTLERVCEFAKQQIGAQDSPVEQKFELVTTDVPKRVFTNMSITLEEAGIEDKTLLHLQASDTDFG